MDSEAAVGEIKIWSRLILDSIVFTGILLVTGLVLFKQRSFNPTICTQLALLIVCYVGFEIRDFQKVLSDFTTINNKDMPEWIWIPYSLS